MELLADSKYRAFADALFNSLATFEKAKDWPDLIKCLSKVQKVKYSIAQNDAILKDEKPGIFPVSLWNASTRL